MTQKRMTQEEVTDEVGERLYHYVAMVESLQEALAFLLERDLDFMRTGKSKATRGQIKAALLEFAEKETGVNCHTYAGLLTSAFQAFDADKS